MVARATGVSRMVGPRVYRVLGEPLDTSAWFPGCWLVHVNQTDSKNRESGWSEFLGCASLSAAHGGCGTVRTVTPTYPAACNHRPSTLALRYPTSHVCGPRQRSTPPSLHCHHLVHRLQSVMSNLHTAPFPLRHPNGRPPWFGSPTTYMPLTPVQPLDIQQAEGFLGSLPMLLATSCNTVVLDCSSNLSTTSFLHACPQIQLRNTTSTVLPSKPPLLLKDAGLSQIHRPRV
jgi:hypothetical protein